MFMCSILKMMYVSYCFEHIFQVVAIEQILHELIDTDKEYTYVYRHVLFYISKDAPLSVHFLSIAYNDRKAHLDFLCS